MSTFAVIGAKGKLGRLICEVGKESHTIISISKEDSLTSIEKTDCIIDVSTVEAMNNTLKYLMEAKLCIPYVVGVTGWQDQILFEKYSKTARILISPNFSPTVTLFLDLAQHAAKYLHQLGYTAEISETHHIHKLDKPSGTAKKLADVVSPIPLTIDSIRENEVIGLHSVRFVHPKKEDEFIMTHDAKDRKIFARGAILAAEWLAKCNKKFGLFSMRDVFTQS
ncbi:MAG: 4-hydroxy-tetrahydrodipicolinate reductase [Bacteriovoracia bacterium]